MSKILHKHHKIPKHVGGTDDPDNIIMLTIEEHAETHKLLWEKHGRWQDRLAWLSLSKMIGRDEHLSELAKALWKQPGYKERVGAAISASLKGVTHRSGYKQDPEWIEKRTAKLRNKPFTEKHVAALSAGQKDKVWWTNGTETTRALECPGPGWVRGRKLVNKSDPMLEIWAKRKSGLLPMPDYNKE